MKAYFDARPGEIIGRAGEILHKLGKKKSSFYFFTQFKTTIQKYSPNKSSLNEILSTISCFMTFAFGTYTFNYGVSTMVGKN